METPIDLYPVSPQQIHSIPFHRNILNICSVTNTATFSGNSWLTDAGSYGRGSRYGGEGLWVAGHVLVQ